MLEAGASLWEDQSPHSKPLLCPRDFLFGDDLLDDFRNFLYVIFRRVLGAYPTELQYDIADYIANGPEFRMAQAPRGTGKSRITQSYVPFRQLREWHYTSGRPDFHAGVISANGELSGGATYFIQRCLETVPECKVLLPTDPAARWSAYGFDVNGARPHPVPSVFSRGIFSRLTGDRGNLLVPDDIEVPSNAETAVMRDKLRERAAEFFDLLVPEGGELAALGTPQTSDTVYGYFEKWGISLRTWTAEYVAPEKNEAVYRGCLSPTQVAAVEADPSLVGTPTEPSRFGVAELAKRKTSPARFALQYMLDTSLSDVDKYPLRLADLIVMPLDTDVGPERPIWSGSPDHVLKDVLSIGMGSDSFHGPMGIVDQKFMPYDYKVMYVDPSGKGKDETGEATIATIGGYVYLLSSSGYQDGYADATYDALIDTAERLRIHLIVVEPNFGGENVAALLRRKVADRRRQREKEGKPGLTHPDGPWHGCSVEVGAPRTSQKEKRIIHTLEPVMNQHRLVVAEDVVRNDRGREGQHGSTYRLFHQMTRICDIKQALIHDDRLDALAGAVEQVIDRMHVQQDEAAEARQAEEDQAMWDWYYENNLDGWMGVAPARGVSATDNITAGRVNPLASRQGSQIPPRDTRRGSAWPLRAT